MVSQRFLRQLGEGWVPDGESLLAYPTRLNLGSGHDYRPGWINADKYAPRADSRFDIFSPPYPFKDGEIDYVHAEQILEHVPHRFGDRDGLIAVLEELHRILRPGGLLS